MLQFTGLTGKDEICISVSDELGRLVLLSSVIKRSLNIL